jgi:hypothetical protein
MDAVSEATERPWPHRIRIVSYGYEDIYGRNTQNARLCQSGISPKGGKNQDVVAGFAGYTSEGSVYTTPSAPSRALMPHPCTPRIHLTVCYPFRWCGIKLTGSDTESPYISTHDLCMLATAFCLYAAL